MRFPSVTLEYCALLAALGGCGKAPAQIVPLTLADHRAGYVQCANPSIRKAYLCIDNRGGKGTPHWGKPTKDCDGMFWQTDGYWCTPSGIVDIGIYDKNGKLTACFPAPICMKIPEQKP